MEDTGGIAGGYKDGNRTIDHCLVYVTTQGTGVSDLSPSVSPSGAKVGEFWRVFRADISSGELVRVTPDGIDAVTPAAINGTKVAVATIRQKSRFSDVRVEAQYRHIEIFYSTSPEQPIKITQKTRPKADHFNPFVIDGGKRIGYHRCKATFQGPDNIFSPVWNQDPQKDALYVCMGPSFNSSKTLDICAIPMCLAVHGCVESLQEDSIMPSIHQSRRDEISFSIYKRWSGKEIQESIHNGGCRSGEYGNGKITRLTNGQWTDTHCQWSPTGDWIIFSSTRDKPDDAPETDNYLDPGYFAVYLVKANDPSVVVRVIKMSVDPISLPMFLHSVRPYGDVFTVDIDPYDINKNKDVKKFNRITHSRYENSTPTWTCFATEDPNATWNLLLKDSYTPSCPYAYPDGGESWHMTGHLCIPKRCC
ncbi:hypothetical protein GH714_025151 [Hevea brasiliensis]|uniref:Dipeptidylpeptidase IV N-terminal domain-containing protein n=1 Tax=Hevea brasiliensis TaxID=3981 RepID=A0A6A6N6J0_HEVBR|nr:hypothetical protein GH714_025151 [Hevea brasiliensis]